MSKKIEQLYQIFASDGNSFFDWHDIISFSDGIKSEYYREITIDQYEKLTAANKKL